MASTAWSKLNPAERKKALTHWHARQNANQPTTPADARKAALTQIVAPGLTEGQLEHEVNSQTALKYGPTQQQLQRQPAQVNDYFSQYQKAIQDAEARRSAAYAGANQTLTNLQGGLDTASKDQWAGQQAAMGADAAARGATVDPKLADQAHNASNIRNILTNSYGAQLAVQGANEGDRLANQKVISGQQRGETLSANRQQLADLLGQKGSFKASTRQSIISDASSNALKNALTEAQIGGTAATTAKTKATTKATNAETAFLNKYGYKPGSSSPTDQVKLDYFRSHGYWPPTGPPKKPTVKKTTPTSGPGSLSSSAEQKRLSQVRKVAQIFKTGVTVQVKQLDGSYKPKVIAKPGDVQAIKNYLAGQTVDPLAIQVGESLYVNKGKLGVAGVYAAHKYGVHVGGNFGIAPTGAGAIPGVQ